MSTITLTPDTIEVTFTTAEKVAGLVRDQSIPRSSITEVTVVDDGLSATRGMRAPGLGLPGLRKIGTWRRKSGKELVAVRRGEPAVRITLQGHAHRAAVLGSADADALAQALAGAQR